MEFVSTFVTPPTVTIDHAPKPVPPFMLLVQLTCQVEPV
jgi:hypothetical protein